MNIKIATNTDIILEFRDIMVQYIDDFNDSVKGLEAKFSTSSIGPFYIEYSSMASFDLTNLNKATELFEKYSYKLKELYNQVSQIKYNSIYNNIVISDLKNCTVGKRITFYDLPLMFNDEYSYCDGHGRKFYY